MTILFATYSIIISFIAIVLSTKLSKMIAIDKAQEGLIKAQQQKIDLLELRNKDLDEECDMLSDLVEANIMNTFDTVSNNVLSMEIAHVKDLQEMSKKAFEENEDTREKRIGDRVKIWNFYLASNEDMTPFCDEKYIDQTAIVIQEGLSLDKAGILNIPYKLDLQVKFEDGTKVYTKSQYVKREDSYTK